MKTKRTFWSKETVIAESKKYKTKKDFEKGNGGAYQYARNHKLIPELFPYNGQIRSNNPQHQYFYEYEVVSNCFKKGIRMFGITTDFLHRYKEHQNSLRKYMKANPDNSVEIRFVRLLKAEYNEIAEYELSLKRKYKIEQKAVSLPIDGFRSECYLG